MTSTSRALAQRRPLEPKHKRSLRLIHGLSAVALCAGSSVHAFETTSGDWKFSVNGNVNVHYVYSSCEKGSSAASIVTVGGACTGSGNSSSVSNVGNGLLPAAISFGVATQQEGFDLAAHFGFYPGIATNDGGSPNLQQTGANTNTALGTTGLDVRQVYMTFGNKDIGTFMLGRNFGLFGFDAIINDMTIPGVGVAGSMSGRSPANTSLGSIGFGYIYVDTLAQMNYTTPDWNGLNLTLGIFDPINSITANGDSQAKSAPGFHGKLAYTNQLDANTKLYLSSAFIDQQQKYLDAGNTDRKYTGFGIDVAAKLDWYAAQLLASYYHGSGLGTTGLFVLSDDGAGNKRDSYGYLIQGTYKFDKLKLGVNYGVSRLDFANSTDQVAVPNLLQTNSKVTGGTYYSLTKALTLLAEVSDVNTKAHNDGKNHSTNFNVGAFLAF